MERSDSQLDGLDDFSYDHCGNLASKDGRTFVNDGWQLDHVTNSQGATECSFKYSADGNLIAKSDGAGAKTSEMKYDADGRLSKLNGTSFTYDFGGHLIKVVRANGDVTIYPNQTYEIDISATGAKSHTSYLVHGYRRASATTTEETTEKEMEGEKPAVPTVHYFHSDQLGSTIAASDANGAIVTQYRYDAFGKATVHGPDVARYKFSGKELFGDLYYFGARFYDPDVSLLLHSFN